MRTTAPRLLRRAVAFTCAALAGVAHVTGCTADGARPPSLSADEVTAVRRTSVREQTIENCWIYATASWVESMRQRFAADDTPVNLSESYLTYWDWYLKLTREVLEAGPQLSARGGGWGTAANLLLTRGLALEPDFIREEATTEMSARQHRALAAINASLREGLLRTPEARRDGRLVRDELDRAFELEPRVVADLDRLFGEDGARTLDAVDPGAASWVVHPSRYLVDRGHAPDGTAHDVTLTEALGQPGATIDPDDRQGVFAWRGAASSSFADARHALVRRVLRAINDDYPVVVTWLVDTAALTDFGDFWADHRAPGANVVLGTHLTIAVDYVVDDVPGLGTLGEGTVAPDLRARALDGRLRYLVIQNSWGSMLAASHAGYHHLYWDYLETEVPWQPGAPTGSRSTCRRYSTSCSRPGTERRTRRGRYGVRRRRNSIARDPPSPSGPSTRAVSASPSRRYAMRVGKSCAGFSNTASRSLHRVSVNSAVACPLGDATYTTPPARCSSGSVC